MPTLSYFDFPGGRGEDCRIALHWAGVDFEDDRVPGSTWMERKGSTPYGALPVYREDDGREIGQSNAILAYLGRRHGLLPSDPLEAARHEALMHAVEDFRKEVEPTLRIKDADEKRARREAIRDGYVQRWAANVEKQIRGPFVGGAEASVADLKLWVLLRWIYGGSLDHIGPEAFAATPGISAFYAAMSEHPAVQAWYASRQ